MRVILALMLGLLSLTAQAQKSSFSCVPSNNSILFGTFDPLLGSVLDSTGTFIVSCTDAGGKPSRSTTLNYSVALSNAALRQMAPTQGTSADRLNYNIFTNTARSIPWGDGTTGVLITGSFSVPGLSTVSSAPIAYYGRIAAPQDVSAVSPPFAAPTTYSQTLTMTVTCTVLGSPVPC